MRQGLANIAAIIALGVSTSPAALWAKDNAPQDVAQAFIAMADWCAAPGVLHKTESATEYGDQMMASLGKLGWEQITEDKLTPETEERVALLFGVPTTEEGYAEALVAWKDHVRFLVQSPKREGESAFFLLHNSQEAVVSVNIIDTDYAQLGLRQSCYSAASEDGATALVAKLTGSPITWPELQNIFLPNGAPPLRPMNVTKPYLTGDPREKKNLEASLHPRKINPRDPDANSYPYAMLLKIQSLYSPEVPQ